MRANDKTKTRKAEVPKGEPFNQFLVFVAVKTNASPGQFFDFPNYVTADMGTEAPAPPLTIDELQEVAFHAKAALADILRRRKAPPRAR